LLFDIARGSRSSIRAGHTAIFEKNRAAHGLERFRAKACPGLDPGWIPVRVKKTRQNKNLEPRSDSIGTEKALGAMFSKVRLRQSWRSLAFLSKPVRRYRSATEE
jgi:hypothetical protein